MEAPAPPMLCSSMGATKTLLEKMDALTENRRNPKIKDLMQLIQSLRDDFLDKFSGRRAKSEQVKVWMKQAREMIYDIEDWIDLRQEAANEESDEKQIKTFKRQIEEARERCERYELPSQVPAVSDPELVYGGSSGEAASTGCVGLLGKKTAMVGIGGAKSKLLNHLKNEQEELMVVSILGAGGHGKTSLAKEICGDTHIKEQFECQAFVSVGRTTSTRITLIDILTQVKPEADAAWQSTRSCNEVVTEIWGFLRTKRYFICIDDMRDTNDSEFIFCALPENNLGSRILTTTRIEDIAISCSSRPNDLVHEMIPLDETYSKSLFHNSLYVEEEKWPDNFKQCSKKMLELCAGVPMAIIIAAGLFGRSCEELSVQSEMLIRTILSELDQFYSASQAMRTILDISYGDLPLPLKSGLLYMAAFPGNSEIKKDRLIRRWVAEGIVPERHGKSSWKTGESYFDELITRRLIQPAFDDNDDQPIGCTVPGVVFDFIESLSAEANFITQGAELMSGLVPCDRVRRVSIAYGDDEEGDTFIPITYCLLEQKKSLVASSNDVSSSFHDEEANEDEAIYLHLSRVRSLAFSGDAKKLLDISALKHVRVLDLEDIKCLELKQLESIGHLSLLRYLGLGGTNVTQLPQEIMALQQLTTLDLRRTRVRRLPPFQYTKLVSLLADELAILPRQMMGMQNLEELSKVILGDDGSFPDEVARLVRDLRCLRMLGARFGHLNCENRADRQGVKRLLEEAGKSNLQSILLDNYLHPLLDLLAGPWANNLGKFELRIRGCLPQVPQEIASLIGLTHLQINVEAVEGQAVRALGTLPKLVLLKLESNVSSSLTVTKDDGFKCLRVFWYTNSQYGGGVGLNFQGGAMPRLERLRLDFSAWEPMPSNDDGFDFGIKKLTCLEQIHATIDWMNTTLTASEVKAAETHIREQVSGHSNNPVFELNRRRKRPAAMEVEPEKLVIEVHSLEEWSKLIDPDKLVVVQFSAEWCPASRKMAPVFSDFAKKFRDAVFLKVDVDADDMDTIAEEFDVEGVPTFVFIKGGHGVERVIGAHKEELEEILEDQVA
ncbi:hypothetical protein U9M48_000727 [Paspalum notatum var. saurae]|uniref:Thioredoxin domain-containing protein n=1 Tax=Paspalum notatum var. saurae TaxID=547442 RepID=A0AAQ3PE79_PASNO